MSVNLTDSFIQNPGGIANIVQALPQQLIDKLSLLIDIGKILAIITIVYFIILIISKIWGMRDSRNIRKIATSVAEINSKLSILTEKRQKPEKKNNEKIRK